MNALLKLIKSIVFILFHSIHVMTSYAKYPESVREDNEYTARMND
jgi:hypothetical protein